MSKEKEQIVDEPFKGFSILTGPTVGEPKKENDEKGSKGEVIDSKESSGDAEVEENETAEVEAKLDEIAEKQAKATAKKDKATPKEKEVTKEKETQVEDEQIEESEASLEPFIKALSEKGIIDFNEEDFKDDDFKDEAVIEKAIGKTIEKAVNDWKSGYPEETKAFLEFVENGGNPKQFLDVYYGNQSWEDFKPENESAQKLVIREGLKTAGWEDSEIEDEITLYEDSGKLEAKATQHLAKLKKYEVEAKQELIKQQEAYNKKREAEAKEYYDNLHKHWYEKEELNGFKLNKNTKDKVWDFIYKLDKKTGKTGLQESYEKNTDAQFMYAYLAMNNFDLSKLEKIVESKVTSKVRQSLSNYTDQRFKTTKGVTEKENKVSETTGFNEFKRIL